ncbi:MAG: hypothetical protein WC971_08405 [Coriobacteriia bacterium]
MARRSPFNARYTEPGKKGGSTRKSASSMKPKRAAGEVAGRKSATAKPAVKRKPWQLPSSPEIKKWRRVWWVFMGVAILSAASILVPPVKGSTDLQRISLAIEVSGLAAALYIDFAIVRKLRKELIAGAKSGKKVGASGTGKDA